VPNVSVDSVVFGFDSINLNVLLVERNISYGGINYHDWKFPGDLIRKDEDLDTASKRILKDLTGLDDIYMKQLKAFGALDRLTKRPQDMAWLVSIDHPEDRVITIPYYALINLEKNGKKPGVLNENAKWFPVDEATKLPLAFDHLEILEFALETLRNEVRTKPLAFELLPQKFSLSQLQKIYEVIFQMSLDKRNFRKKISNLSYIVSLNEKEDDVSHRPAKLYMFSRDVYQKLKSQNFDFTI
ncbi:MAG: NUDIX hydrolase, partial [Bacteroidales bacterium]|nr:NUDIX hydrolase [Bacteroidales bacterium]